MMGVVYNGTSEIFACGTYAKNPRCWMFSVSFIQCNLMLSFLLLLIWCGWILKRTKKYLLLCIALLCFDLYKHATDVHRKVFSRTPLVVTNDFSQEIRCTNS